MVVAKELLQVIKEKEAKAVNGAEGMISQKDNSTQSDLFLRQQTLLVLLIVAYRASVDLARVVDVEDEG